MQWSSNGQRMDVRLHGAVTFTDDLTDVLTLDDGGSLTIRDWSSLVPHTIEITSIGGTLTHAYFVGGSRAPVERRGATATGGRAAAARAPLGARRGQRARSRFSRRKASPASSMRSTGSRAITRAACISRRS